MRPYLDAGYLLTLLVKTTGSVNANEWIRRLEGPVALNALHRFQAEVFLQQLRKSQRSADRTKGAEALRLWENYLAEGVFQLTLVEWEAAFNLATSWSAYFVQPPPPPLLILHPALAALAEADHFFSFDPRSRAMGRALGLELIPAEL